MGVVAACTSQIVSSLYLAAQIQPVSLPFHSHESSMPPAARKDCKAASTILNSLGVSIPRKVLLEGLMAAFFKGCTAVRLIGYLSSQMRKIHAMKKPLHCRFGCVIAKLIWCMVFAVITHVASIADFWLQ